MINLTSSLCRAHYNDLLDQVNLADSSDTYAGLSGQYGASSGLQFEHYVGGVHQGGQPLTRSHSLVIMVQRHRMKFLQALKRQPGSTSSYF